MKTKTKRISANMALILRMLGKSLNLLCGRLLIREKIMVKIVGMELVFLEIGLSSWFSPNATKIQFALSLCERHWNMSERNLKKPSETDWARIDSMTDEEIDTSDIPPLDDEFFAAAQWRMPERKTTVTLSVDDDVLKWFEAQGGRVPAAHQCSITNLRKSTSRIESLKQTRHLTTHWTWPPSACLSSTSVGFGQVEWYRRAAG
jgi:uncharacterized protein (DUF4415 family)